MNNCKDPKCNIKERPDSCYFCNNVSECDYRCDNPESRQLVIDFASWEDRQEFIEFLQEKGIPDLKEYYNDYSKDMVFKYAGNNRHDYIEEKGQIAYIQICEPQGIGYWEINKNFVVGYGK